MTAYDIVVPLAALVVAAVGAGYFKWAGDRLEVRLRDREEKNAHR